MKSIIIIIIVLISLIAPLTALYKQCAVGRKVGDLDALVRVSGCRKTYCRLKKRYSTEVTFRFTPDKDTRSIRNSVSATIAGIPFPFIGFDGTDACQSVFEQDRVTQASCPLKAGREYYYKTHINVLPIYPSIRLQVRWALQSPQGQLMCFEVPARIVN